MRRGPRAYAAAGPDLGRSRRLARPDSRTRRPRPRRPVARPQSARGHRRCCSSPRPSWRWVAILVSQAGATESRTYSSGSTVLTLNGRTSAWKAALGSAQDWPLGRGVGEVGTAATRATYTIAPRGRADAQTRAVDSGYLATIADVGVVGLAVLLALFARLLVLATRAIRRGYDAGLARGRVPRRADARRRHARVVHGLPDRVPGAAARRRRARVGARPGRVAPPARAGGSRLSVRTVCLVGLIAGGRSGIPRYAGGADGRDRPGRPRVPRARRAPADDRAGRRGDRRRQPHGRARSRPAGAVRRGARPGRRGPARRRETLGGRAPLLRPDRTGAATAAAVRGDGARRCASPRLRARPDPPQARPPAIRRPSRARPRRRLGVRTRRGDSTLRGRRGPRSTSCAPGPGLVAEVGDAGPAAAGRAVPAVRRQPRRAQEPPVPHPGLRARRHDREARPRRRARRARRGGPRRARDVAGARPGGARARRRGRRRRPSLSGRDRARAPVPLRGLRLHAARGDGARLPRPRERHPGSARDLGRRLAAPAGRRRGGLGGRDGAGAHRRGSAGRPPSPREPRRSPATRGTRRRAVSCACSRRCARRARASGERARRRPDLRRRGALHRRPGEELRERGHDAFVLSAFPSRGQLDVPSLALHRSDWRTDPTRRVRNRAGDFAAMPWPRLERAVAAAAPDVVHTGNLPGLGTGVWEVARRLAVPVVHTLHDYYLLCARTSLVRSDGRACTPHPALCGLRSRRLARWSSAVSQVVAGSAHLLGRHRDLLPGRGDAGDPAPARRDRGA